MSDIPLAIPSPGQQTEELIDSIRDMTSVFNKEDLIQIYEDIGAKVAGDTSDIITDIVETASSKRTNRVTEGIRENLKNFSDKTVDVLNTTKENLVSGLAGPFKLLTEPLKELTGFDLIGKIGEIGKIKVNSNPTKKDLAKTPAGQAVLYQEGQRTKKKDEKDGKGFLAKLGPVGKALAKILPIALPILAIAGGIIWAVIDGIKAAFLAKKWGVTKISAFVGGFLAGTGSGWKNAFKQGGKWALMGAGIGFLAGGPVGAIAGGLIGASIGLVFGWIGGKEISQGIENTKSKFSALWSDKKKGFDQKLLGSISLTMDTYIKGLSRLYQAGTEMIYSFFQKDPSKRAEFKKKSKKVLKKLVMFTPFGFLNTQIKTFRKDFDRFKSSKGESSFALRIGTLLADFALNGIKALFATFGIDDITKELKELDPLGKLKDFVINLKDNLFGFFTYLGDFFGFLKDKVESKGGILGLVKTMATGKFSEQFGEFREEQEEKRSMEDNSLDELNQELTKNMLSQKEKDQAIVDELKKLNEKDLRSQAVVQTNISSDKFNANNYRDNLSYAKRYGR